MGVKRSKACIEMAVQVQRQSLYAAARRTKFSVPHGGSHMNEMMLTLYVNLQHLLKEEDGQDLVEYALIVALIAIGCCAGLGSVATVINNLYLNKAAGILTNSY